jgi:hypothetical protein
MPATRRNETERSGEPRTIARPSRSSTSAASHSSSEAAIVRTLSATPSAARSTEPATTPEKRDE